MEDFGKSLDVVVSRKILVSREIKITSNIKMSGRDIFGDHVILTEFCSLFGPQHLTEDGLATIIVLGDERQTLIRVAIAIALIASNLNRRSNRQYRSRRKVATYTHRFFRKEKCK